MKRLTLLLALLMTFVLGGCASVRRIDSDVTTVVATAAGQNLQGAHYRFERLPSQVSLVMRDLRSGQVVYETRARHDGPWADSTPVFATLFQAAMAGFPNPPASPRKVFIDIPR